MEIVRETNFNILLKIFLTTTIAGGKWNKNDNTLGRREVEGVGVKREEEEMSGK